MIRLIAKRFLSAVPSLIGVIIVTFVISHTLPGDPAAYFVGPSATAESIAETKARLGLDQPLPVQFFHYVVNVLSGDFGRSVSTGRLVSEDLARFFPATLEMATIGIIIGVLLGVPMGVYAAAHRGRPLDQVIRVIGMLGYSVPAFWLGLVGLALFYARFGLVGGPGRLDIFYDGLVPPVTGLILVDSLIAGETDIFFNAISHIILPASLLGYYSLAYISRMTRSFMLEQLSSEYVTTARVKGVSEWHVVWRHAFRNIRIQLITVIALAYANLLEGSVLTEIIFAWPGIGQYITTSLLANDMNSVLGGTIVIGTIFVAINIFSDLLYRFFDPRSK